MPGTTASASASAKPSEPEKPIKPVEQIALGADDNMEKTLEEDVEYEEIEERVEKEEVEEQEEVEEKEKEDEEEVDGHGGQKGLEADDNMETVEGEEDVKKKHAELLTLPPEGFEVIFDGIPQNISGDDLKRLCESFGEVTMVRIRIRKNSEKNKRCATVAFRTEESVAKAIERLNNTEFKGKKLKCSTPLPRNKLFIGKVPKTWGEEDMKRIANEAGPGVIGVELVKDPKNSSLNLGFAFIEYYNRACALYSNQKMSNSKFKLDDKAPIVSWTDSRCSYSSPSKVKVLCVENFPENVTRDQLKELFEHHGEITSVVLPRAKPGQEKSRYGFLHFAERSSALKALYSTENYEIDGQVVELSLSTRRVDRKSSEGSNAQNAAILQTYPPDAGHALVGAPYGAPGVGYAGAGFVQPSEPEKPIKTVERIELGADKNMEETVEEEVEHEEIEEEVEVEEDEEKEDKEEVDGHGGRKGLKGDDNMETAEGEEDEEKKHAELLAMPPQGFEVYLGGIPQNISEDELKCFCETIGEVKMVRIIKTKNSKNKRYAIVAFRTEIFVAKAIEKLHNYEFKGKKLKCYPPFPRNKLFIGKVPKTWGEEDMKRIANEVGPGVITVELVKDPKNSSLNLGFAFIEYYNRACADYSYQKMSNSKFKLDDKAPIVSWTDSRCSYSSPSKVKVLRVENLAENVTRDQLTKLFEHHGEITSVVIPRAKPGQEKSRYGFLHFAERSSALKALYSTENYEINGQVVELSISTRRVDRKSSEGSNAQNAAILQTYPPDTGQALVGAPYGAPGVGSAGAGFVQPPVYGMGADPVMVMMPVMLPDGRICYVPHQPVIQLHAPPPPQRGGWGSERGSSSGR